MIEISNELQGSVSTALNISKEKRDKTHLLIWMYFDTCQLKETLRNENCSSLNYMIPIKKQLKKILI